MHNHDEAQAAGKWFINRFIHTRPARTFALNMLEGRPVKMRVRAYNARYDMVFHKVAPGQVLVIPLGAEAEWARGTIFTEGAYQYYCEPEAQPWTANES